MDIAQSEAALDAVVTGGTEGVGKEIARGLARRGHRVIIAGLDPIKGVAAERDLRGTTGNASIYFIAADLSSIGKVRAFAEEIRRRTGSLRYLVLNAGMVRGKQTFTEDHIEANFALNYLSRFVLANELLPLLEKGGSSDGSARILSVSGAAQGGTIHYEDVNLTHTFSVFRMVLQFCAANDVFIIELARRLGTKHITATSLKLGVVKTGIRRQFPLWMRWLVPLVFDPFLGLTAEQAASPAIALLLDKAFEGTTGALFRMIKKFKKIKPDKMARDEREGKKLWAWSERLVATIMAHITEQFPIVSG